VADVVVVGGGLVGMSAAYRLARDGARVTLVDAGRAGQATAAGAGIISPGDRFGDDGPILPLVERATNFYPELLASLADDGERLTGYEVVGTLHIASSEEEATRLPAVARRAAERRRAGFGHVGEVEQVDGAAARALFPALGPVHGAVHLSGSARVDGRLLRDALERAARRRGLAVLHGAAELRPVGERVTGVAVGGQVVGADAVIVAAGAWSGALAGQLGLKLPVYPQRGQIAHLLLPGAETGRWPIVVGFHSHYLLTFPERRVVAGATREDGPGDDPRLTAAGVHEVLGEALRVAPGLAGATVHEVRVGLRPASPDRLPVLGPAPGFGNVLFATGHGPSGLQLGPWSGAAMADLALGRPVPLDLAPFAAGRFQRP
jgi:D-amino-acid dehydrogenase